MKALKTALFWTLGGAMVLGLVVFMLIGAYHMIIWLVGSGLVP